jgi:Protein of unknown function (DUF1559)
MKRFLTIVVLFLAASSAFAQPTKLPPDLALVPESGIGIIHVKVADLWGHESLKDIRDILKKAGDKAIASLDERFAGLSSPSNIERVTIWIGPTRSKSTIDSDYLFIIRVAQPMDAPKLRKLLVPDAKEVKGKRFPWYVDVFGASLLIADDRTFVLGPKDEVARIANADPAIGNFLRESIAVAASDRPLVIGVVPSALPAEWQAEVMKEIPSAIHPMLIVKSGIVSLDLVGEGHLHLDLAYPTTTGAEAGERMIKSANGPVRKLIASTIKELEEMVFDEKAVAVKQLPLAAAATLGLGVLKRAEEILESDKVRRDGSNVLATVELPTGSKTILVPAAFATGAVIGGIASHWREDIQARHTNNLKQIILGLHNINDTNGQAEAAIKDGDGKPLLSWRVALLPFLEEDNLYRQFKLDEPWDSEHNKKLIEKMPKIFEIEGVTTKKGYTHYRSFVGEKAIWDFNRSLMIGAVPDGTSNTIVFVQAKEPVIWTKPEELIADGKVQIRPQLLFREGRTIVGMADGSVKVLKDTVDEKIWKLLVDPADGEVIPWEKLK